MTSLWPSPHHPTPVNGTVFVPGSKSLMARYMIIAAMGDKPSVIHAPLRARDTYLMADALRALGIGVEWRQGSDESHDVLTITPRVMRSASIEAGLAGTVMRFVPPLAALIDGTVHIDGDETARVRPMGPVVTALRELGVEVEAVTLADGTTVLPVTVYGVGRVEGGELNIDSSASSQFISALLLAAPRFERGLHLRSVGEKIPSTPHLKMTVDVLRRAGITVEEFSRDGKLITNTSKTSEGTQPLTGTDMSPLNDSKGTATAKNVHGGTTVCVGKTQGEEHARCSQQDSRVPSAANPTTEEPAVQWRVHHGVPHLGSVVVEPDLSNASPFLAAAMVTGGTVSIPNWPEHTTQPGAQAAPIFESMGATISFEKTGPGVGTLSLTGPEKIRPLDRDLADVGELTPTLAAVCALAEGSSRLRNIGQLRGHETNRLAAITTELNKLGITAYEEGDDIIILDPNQALHAWNSTQSSAQLASYEDHRMATFAAILGLRFENIVVENIETTSKTMPRFADMWKELLGG